jgi:hypothetical protein
LGVTLEETDEKEDHYSGSESDLESDSESDSDWPDEYVSKTDEWSTTEDEDENILDEEHDTPTRTRRVRKTVVQRRMRLSKGAVLITRCASQEVLK